MVRGKNNLTSLLEMVDFILGRMLFTCFDLCFYWCVGKVTLLFSGSSSSSKGVVKGGLYKKTLGVWYLSLPVFTTTRFPEEFGNILYLFVCSVYTKRLLDMTWFFFTSLSLFSFLLQMQRLRRWRFASCSWCEYI